MPAGEPRSTKVPLTVEDFPESVKSSRAVPRKSAIHADGAAFPVPAPVEHRLGGRGFRARAFYPDLFMLQPGPYGFEVEFPLRSNFPGGAPPQEPIVHVPGPHVQFFGYLVSVHCLFRNSQFIGRTKNWFSFWTIGSYQ
jgi:hypothetical protein